MNKIGQRIVVLGVTGSGKSTLAKAIANIYAYNYIELDNLFWKPNWERSSDEEFADKVQSSLAQHDCWVVDGNYTRVGTDRIWTKADTFIWLDYPLRVNFWRLWKRTWTRFLKQEPLWESGNKETLWKHFFTKDSLFLWAVQSYPTKKNHYLSLFASPEYAHCSRIRLQSPKETNNWLDTLKSDID